MPRTLIKSKLHYNKHKPKVKQEQNNNSNLPQIFKYLNKNYYQETALLNINSFFTL